MAQARRTGRKEPQKKKVWKQGELLKITNGCHLGYHNTCQELEGTEWCACNCHKKNWIK